MILKLKDWPDSADFKHILPSRFDDLMSNLPIAEYTLREGSLNLVSTLPSLFLKPDLGPKLYIAYSSAETPREGTTNLHVDISDALNLMIYVGESKSETNHKHNDKEVLSRVLMSSNCDKQQLDRYLNGERPGAIWHLFRPQDADKIRTFLYLVNKFYLKFSLPSKN